MDATLVVYTGLPLPYITVNPGDNLQTILASIDTAVNAMNPAPDYTPYNLQCLRPTYTITDTQEFAEAVADFICLLRSDYDTFTSTTYVSDIAAIQAILDSITDPALVYAPFGIVNTDNLSTVYSKLFAGLSTMISNADPGAANWASIGASVPSTVADAFDEMITYGLSLASLIAGKEDSIGTFDNSANCLTTYGGGSTDDPRTTIDLLTAAVCATPVFDPGNVTWGCVAPGSDLETGITNICSTLGGVMQGYVGSVGTGLLLGPIVSCTARSVSINPAYTGLFRVAIDSVDAAANTADYLENKITSSDSSITIDTVSTPGVMDLTVTTPVSNEVKVNNNDAAPGFLQAKLPGSTGGWGLSIAPVPSYDNSQLFLNPTVSNASILVNNFLQAIQDDPELLAKFCATVDMCGGCLCDTVTDLVVTRNGNNIVLNWTPAGGNSTGQVAKYRETNTLSWLTGNFTPANILAANAATTTASGLLTNVVYDFQIDTNCPGDVGVGNIAQMVKFAQQAVTDVVVGSTVSVTQNPIATASVIDYRLVNQNLQVVDSVSATGINPSASFLNVSAGNYTVDYRYGALVNGVTLYSDDATQSNAWYSTGTIVV